MHCKRGIVIAPLYTCIDSIPILAKIWCDVLGQHWLPDTSVQKIEQDLSHNMAQDGLPTTLVATHHTTPIGMVSLCEKDGLESSLSPWLSDFVVEKAYQNRGVGNKLMRSALIQSTKLGYKKLHLFTFDDTLPLYYERFGWKKLAHDVYKTHPVSIMQIDLTENTSLSFFQQYDDKLPRKKANDRL